MSTAAATRIKFCGLTRREDIEHAARLGVDHVGFVFAARSPRRLPLDAARALRAAVPARVGLVALVMDTPADEVAAVVDAVAPDVLQFHGREDDEFCAGFGLPYWKAVAMGGDPARALASLDGFPGAAAFLFDGHAAGEPGGGGVRFDWTRLPATLDRPFWLAGGLDAGNVATAIAAAHPAGVDVSSGIESAPGIKDAARMRAFVDAVRRIV
ncbi:phosphoribosylanthranilate isomerase [Luteimonas sp. BDR2-5]|uniref:phosphoribosylanthranilate isomerase n=1 Tax=Proluteimonas luteida TaxID=2878685 RepID=UPI001E5CB6E1|nr:phosphoribosylanthranilate isomerase [Luteimonas sp. BDR2-5]MCD9028550.1 phosphoribosylanthranilate isomerase [Luteimonas sp. BDR2-5]